MAYTPNTVNQYTQVAGVTQSYDTNGNLTNDGTNAFTYDTENHLLTATIGGNVQTYSYDPLGRRKEKVATGPFAGTTSFLHDGNQEIAEYDGAGALLRRYVYGPGIDEPIATIDVSGARSYHHQDGLGSVIALSNGTTGAVAASFAHGQYGETPNATGTAYRYTGRRIDPETGLYYYRARYYSPNLGRFLQTDPIGYQGGLNLYAYVGNSPVNATDPMGLDTMQLGGNVSFSGVGLSGTFFAGLVLDTKLNFAIYYGTGVGYGAGTGFAWSGGPGYSNAQTVNDLRGAFVNLSGGGGAVGRIGLEGFTGPSDNGWVVGGNALAGLGLGGTAFYGPTQTEVIPITGALIRATAWDGLAAYSKFATDIFSGSGTFDARMAQANYIRTVDSIKAEVSTYTVQMQRMQGKAGYY